MVQFSVVSNTPQSWSDRSNINIARGESYSIAHYVSSFDEECTFECHGSLPWGVAFSPNGILEAFDWPPPGDWRGWPTSKVRHRQTGRFVANWYAKRWHWLVDRIMTPIWP